MVLSLLIVWYFFVVFRLVICFLWSHTWLQFRAATCLLWMRLWIKFM
jgi:hypothetical protein